MSLFDTVAKTAGSSSPITLTGSPVQSASNPVVTYNVTTGSVFGDTSTSLPTPGSIFGQGGITNIANSNVMLYAGFALVAFLLYRSLE